MAILNVICILAVLAGLFFFFAAAIGLLRLPDFYTRMHAAGKGDTLSTLLFLTGLALYVNHDDFSFANLLVMAKILGICLFIMLTSPTSTHALMQAGYEEGIKPFTKDDPGKEPS